ncbi:MAG: hypothetical protein ACE5NG_14430 [bacterium]
MAALDQTKLETLVERMTGVLNGGMLSLMTSIGYQTGLFEAMADLPPSTSEQIAEAAELNERYVREWLNTLVTGKIVEYTPDRGTYTFPPEHAATLTHAAGPDNLAAFARMIPILAAVEMEIVDSFRNGGGVFYDQFRDFMALWAGLNALRFERTLISDMMPLMPDVLQALKASIDVLEIGCGEGHSANLMTQAYPNSRFTDVSVKQIKGDPFNNYYLHVRICGESGWATGCFYPEPDARGAMSRFRYLTI